MRGPSRGWLACCLIMLAAAASGQNAYAQNWPNRSLKLVVPTGPANLLVTGGMGKDYNPTTYKVDYPK